MKELYNKLEEAREISWRNLGKKLTVYLPGMFFYDGLKGKYPAVSITGSNCQLLCDHCQGTVLQSMLPAESPEQLLVEGLRISKDGNHGILVSGGCDEEGRLPWDPYIPVIEEIKEKTDLFISVHCGILDYPTALRLKQSGVDQALIDVIGDDETFQSIYHVDFGVSGIFNTMENLEKAGLQIIPHVVCGINYGKIKGEKKALGMISPFKPDQIVIVSLMSIPGTALWGCEPPEAEEIAGMIAEARLLMPETIISLGCARKRGDIRLEILAIDAGINRMALPSEEALKHAEGYGLEIRYQKTCCSVSRDLSRSEW